MKYFETPLDLLEYDKVHQLIEKCGYAGLGVLCNLFIKLGKAQKDLYMIRVDENWYKKFALDGNNNKVSIVKNIMLEMVSIGILDSDFFDLGVLFSPFFIELQPSYISKSKHLGTISAKTYKMVLTSRLGVLDFSITYKAFLQKIHPLEREIEIEREEEREVKEELEKEREREKEETHVFSENSNQVQEIVVNDGIAPSRVEESPPEQSPPEELPPKKKEKPPIRTRLGGWEQTMAEKLKNLVIEREPRLNNPVDINMPEWIATFHWLREKWKDEKEIEQVLEFSQGHKFWKTVILKPDDLKNSYAKMLAQMKNEQGQMKTEYTHAEMENAVEDERGLRVGKDFEMHKRKDETLYWTDKLKTLQEKTGLYIVTYNEMYYLIDKGKYCEGDFKVYDPSNGYWTLREKKV